MFPWGGKCVNTKSSFSWGKRENMRQKEQQYFSYVDKITAEPTRSPLWASSGWMFPCRVRPVLRPAFLQTEEKKSLKINSSDPNRSFPSGFFPAKPQSNWISPKRERCLVEEALAYHFR